MEILGPGSTSTGWCSGDLRPSVPTSIHGLGLTIPMSSIPVPATSSLPAQPVAIRIEEARRHLARAEGALLLIWPNKGETHQHAREAFDGIAKAREALS